MYNNPFMMYYQSMVPNMMRGYTNYDDDLCLYYEKEKVYYDNKYPECFKEALKDLECQKVNVTLSNGETLSDVTLDEVERDYIALRENQCGTIYLIPLNKIVSVGVCEDLAKDTWGRKIPKKEDMNPAHPPYNPCNLCR